MRDTLDSQVSPDMQGIWNLEFKSTDDGFSIDDPALFTAIEEINQFIKSVIGEDDSWSDHEFISPKGENITFKVKTVSIGEREIKFVKKNTARTSPMQIRPQFTFQLPLEYIIDIYTNICMYWVIAELLIF